MNVPNKTSENKSKKKSGKVLISVEAAAAWKVEREQASAEECRAVLILLLITLLAAMLAVLMKIS